MLWARSLAPLRVSSQTVQMFAQLLAYSSDLRSRSTRAARRVDSGVEVKLHLLDRGNAANDVEAGAAQEFVVGAARRRTDLVGLPALGDAFVDILDLIAGSRFATQSRRLFGFGFLSGRAIVLRAG